ncbi:IucA/IucC family protein [Actinomycetospora aeridis]|uniref:IucA/IucC family protein n=1 Tax=Actinomycetospora aeridis TaxID=3129231 RepID=A0ABU8N5R2_9PSEU
MSTDAVPCARAAARERLLNATARELRITPDGVGPWRLDVPAGGALLAEVEHWSPSGHHRWGEEIVLERDAGRRPLDHDEFVDLLLSVIDSVLDDTGPDRVAALAEQVRNSVDRTARYLAAPSRPEPDDPAGRTRHAEQSLRRGHPFHPVPKSVQGLVPEDADRFAPELGASFRLHHLALHPELAVEERVVPGPWTPDDVAAQAPAGWPVVPVHPWQMTYLRGRPPVAALLADGRLRDLGELGRPVYPTSSVRTVCDPASPTIWKLPLHLRITNFVRTIPIEHARRAADASRLVAGLRPQWDTPGFAVLVESGWRGVDPEGVGDDAADLVAVFRENPFVGDAAAPRVLAGMIEPGARGEEPMLVEAVRAGGGDAAAWLRAYLHLSLVPLLEIFGAHGLGFEAHPQNTLLHTDESGRPARFWVRDMEGAHVSRDRAPAAVAAGSPLLYDEEEAWLRLRYHAVVNQLASVVATLGAALAPGEPALWEVVAGVLAEVRAGSGPASPWADDLLTSRTLPAKANLLSRFAERGEHPLYVELPNPIRKAAG